MYGAGYRNALMNDSLYVCAWCVVESTVGMAYCFQMSQVH
jgi:hypothetical protein